MANSNKTKAEILLELESIKGLLLEQEDIPILQEITETGLDFAAKPQMLPGDSAPSSAQVSLFDEAVAEQVNPAKPSSTTASSSATTPSHQAASSANSSAQGAFNASYYIARPVAKASGENPFLPQHIRERLHGNNPPPQFEYETAKKIISATKNIQHKLNKPRQHLIDEVINSIMPQVESELRHRLYSMSVDELSELLKAEE